MRAILSQILGEPGHCHRCRESRDLVLLNGDVDAQQNARQCACLAALVSCALCKPCANSNHGKFPAGHVVYLPPSSTRALSCCQLSLELGRTLDVWRDVKGVVALQRACQARPFLCPAQEPRVELDERDERSDFGEPEGRAHLDEPPE